MKKTRRIAAFAAAMAMAATMAMPMAMNASAESTITVISSDSATHKYEAYQIFSGNFTGGTLNSIAFGTGVNGTQLLADLQTASEDTDSVLAGLFPAATVKDAVTLAEALGATTGTPATAVFGDDAEKTQAFAAIVGKNLTTTKSGTGSADGVSGLADGYYLIQDAEAPQINGGQNSGAKSRYIVQVTDSATVEINAKHVAPTVDKLVKDEAADKDKNSTDTNGWGETADHAINETFQFKLKATLTGNSEYKAYNTYRLVFTDELNEGVTFEDIESVKVNDADVTKYDATTAKSGYLFAPVDTGVAGTTIGGTGYVGGGKFTLTIGDIKQYIPSGKTLGEDEITVEVIYNAHLNENATIEKAGATPDTSYKNVNDVKLSYSNNPNVTGSGDSADIPSTGNPGDSTDTPTPGNDEELGDTPKDYVWVFTYEVDNNKVNELGEKLPGAGFKLYDSSNAEVSLIYDSTLKAYRPIKSSETADEQMISGHGAATDATTAMFNIVGLDAGTYTLKETLVPEGYNKCSDIAIKIDAEHEETAANAAKLVLTADSKNMVNTIQNKKGSTLPSTGGMGTRLFVLGGGCMAGLAGLYIVSKKRSKDAE